MSGVEPERTCHCDTDNRCYSHAFFPDVTTGERRWGIDDSATYPTMEDGDIYECTLEAGASANIGNSTVDASNNLNFDGFDPYICDSMYQFASQQPDWIEGQFNAVPHITGNFGFHPLMQPDHHSTIPFNGQNGLASNLAAFASGIFNGVIGNNIHYQSLQLEYEQINANASYSKIQASVLYSSNPAGNEYLMQPSQDLSQEQMDLQMFSTEMQPRSDFYPHNSDDTSTWNIARNPDTQNASIQPPYPIVGLPVVLSTNSPQLQPLTDRFPCTRPGCPRTFRRISDRRRHSESVHSTDKGRYICHHAGCRKNKFPGYSRPDKLHEHLREKHP
jgi:hypothetical protein